MLREEREPCEKLLIATTNTGKVREFRQLLSAVGRVTLSDLTEHQAMPVVEETGNTFEENAKLKAMGYARLLGTWALADDSGLEVDALAGRPGVHSARWAEMNGEGAGDIDNNKLLLRQLEGVGEASRSARFVCVLVLADPSGKIVLTARDELEGRILLEPRGSGGFGYDPLFCVDSLQQTTGEMSAAQKHAISHRGKAMRLMCERMKEQKLLKPADDTAV